MRKSLKNGEILPKGYGISYFDFPRQEMICYPIPFNWIAKWTVSFYRFISFPKPSRWEKEIQEYGISQYRDGLIQGRSLAFSEGYSTGVEESLKAFGVKNVPSIDEVKSPVKH